SSPSETNDSETSSSRNSGLRNAQTATRVHSAKFPSPNVSGPDNALTHTASRPKKQVNCPCTMWQVAQRHIFRLAAAVGAMPFRLKEYVEGASSKICGTIPLPQRAPNARRRGGK